MNAMDRLFLSDCLVKMAGPVPGSPGGGPGGGGWWDALKGQASGAYDWGKKQFSGMSAPNLGGPNPQSDLYHWFAKLTPGEKILLASIIGGGVGGAERMMSPRLEDRYRDRGAVNRFARGAVRGGATGAGGMGGSLLGEASGWLPQLPGGMNALGAGAGAFAGNRLSRMLME